MLGYMTEKEARKNGFTHHGRYFGIPIWIGDHKDELMVATKWAPMEELMDLAHWIEEFISFFLFKDEEPVFRFIIGREIDDENP